MILLLTIPHEQVSQFDAGRPYKKRNEVNMIHLGDITKIHGDEIEPVDCITFGSPCQDLSIAGRRAGLAGERSGLFMEAVRIIKEMRKATDGVYPTFAIWENVPGAFSSNNGEDFRAVLEELARVEQPNAVIPGPPRGGRWSKAGAIAGNGWSLAWRQLDSQYFGVAQRRKRIALVADFGGQRAGEILFERTSMSRHPDPCIQTWKEATGPITNCPAGNDRMVEGGQNAYTLKIRGGCDGGGKGALVQTEKVGTLSTLQDQTVFQQVRVTEAIPINTQIATRCISMGERTGLGIGKDGDPAFTIQAQHEHGVCYCLAGNIVDRSETAGANGLGVKEEVSYTLNTIDRPAVAYSEAVPVLNDQGGGMMNVTYDITGTLRAAEHGHQPIVFDARGNGGNNVVPTITGDHESRIMDYTALAVERKPTVSYGIGNGQAHAYASKEKSGTLDTMHDAQAVAIEYSGCLNPWDTQARRVYGKDGTFPSLPSRETAGGNQQAVLAGQRTRWIVRRLTPTECERLQGFPDGWTDIGEWTDTKGKKHKPADSPRYKALGNSITLPQWFWIAQKMKLYMGDGAKLGSLFDGIGGFPLVWETTYGTGTARWASEIEEFPIAVTKKHFPERKEYEN